MVLRCAVIGCGRIGCGFDDQSRREIRTHAGSYFKNPNTKLVALCDVDKSKLKKYGKKYNITGLYTKSSEMFMKEHLDCVSICTLVDTHLDLVKEAVNYGIRGIFIEKPISNSLKNAKKIIEICKEHNVTLVVDHQRRFDPLYHYIRKFIKQKLGEIQLVNIYYGSGIANTGSHVFDMIRMMFGEIVSLQGNISKNNSGNKQDPNMDVLLKLEIGANCRLQALDVRNYGLLEMDILGTRGRLKLNLTTNDIEYFKIRVGDYLVYKDLIKSNIVVKRSNLSPIQLGVKNLVNCLQFNKRPLCTGEDGYKSLELIIASIQSSKLSRKLKTPLLNNEYKISSK